MYSPQSLLPAGFTGPISLTPSESEIPVPTTVQFIASATINGATQTLSGLNWSSSNTGLLTVTNDSSSQGLAQAVVPGPVAPTPVTVQACFGSSGICGFASISVTPPALVSIAVMPGTSVMSVPPGIPVTFTATGTFTDGTSSSITPSWASSLGFASINMNTGVASPGTGYGATMITASAPGANGTTITGTATLNVTQVIGTGNPQFNTQYSTASVLNCAYPVGSASQCFNDGKVLIAAGENTNGPVLYGQLYDPVAGTFTVTTGSLSFGRSGGSTATVLDSGKVLIAGGITSALNLPGSAELYDPVTDTFTTVGSLITPRSNHTATLIHCQPCPYNGQVLIAGGQDAFANLLSSAELFDPVSNTFAPAPNMNNPRAHFTATLLDSATGKVLLAGGYNSLAPISAGFFPLSTNTAEVFDPGTGTFTLTGTLASCPDTFGLAYQTATLLNDNSVLIAGGQGFQGSLARFSEPSCSQLFNLATGSFTPTARLYSDRLFDAATLLKNGMLLISGGAPDSSFEPPPYNELFDPNGSAGVGTFTQVGMLLAMRTNAAVALLNDGNVLIAGGDVQGTAEVYRPASLVPPGVTGSSIAITPASASLSVGQAVHFTATANGQTLNALTWSASPVGIVTISNDATNNGTAYAVATGNVTISACAGTACASRLLTVQ